MSYPMAVKRADVPHNRCVPFLPDVQKFNFPYDLTMRKGDKTGDVIGNTPLKMYHFRAYS